ncbi:hypothetical protein M0802_009291 [Mischocyttarus mexicanus]|nr:hypothetical protein M0802_009291 [Mischocyttarus mexicanus]
MSERDRDFNDYANSNGRLCYDKEETRRIVMVIVMVVVSNGVSLKRPKEQQEHAKGHAIVEPCGWRTNYWHRFFNVIQLARGEPLRISFYPSINPIKFV